ncbi:MAG: crossover junction endodeoxyribonuclease RuvC [Steroidobacteraceae bacterium]
MPKYPRSWRNFQPAAGVRVMPQSVTLPDSDRCRVLGLDPGSIRTGFGVIDCGQHDPRHVANGTIKVAGATLAQRLRHIYEAICELVELHQPDEIAIERVFVHRNVDSALKLGQARGVTLCAAASRGAPVYEYAPRAIKLAVVGHGGAEKTQVVHMVRGLLTIEAELGADAADALAICLCHSQSRRMAALAALATGLVATSA